MYPLTATGASWSSGSCPAHRPSKSSGRASRTASCPCALPHIPSRSTPTSASLAPPSTTSSSSCYLTAKGCYMVYVTISDLSTPYMLKMTVKLVYDWLCRVLCRCDAYTIWAGAFNPQSEGVDHAWWKSCGSLLYHRRNVSQNINLCFNTDYSKRCGLVATHNNSKTIHILYEGNCCTQRKGKKRLAQRWLLHWVLP